MYHVIDSRFRNIKINSIQWYSLRVHFSVFKNDSGIVVFIVEMVLALTNTRLKT